jgi:hypothetical protein
MIYLFSLQQKKETVDALGLVKNLCCLCWLFYVLGFYLDHKNKVDVAIVNWFTNDRELAAFERHG